MKRQLNFRVLLWFARIVPGGYVDFVRVLSDQIRFYSIRVYRLDSCVTGVKSHS